MFNKQRQILDKKIYMKEESWKVNASILQNFIPL